MYNRQSEIYNITDSVKGNGDKLVLFLQEQVNRTDKNIGASGGLKLVTLRTTRA